MQSHQELHFQLHPLDTKLVIPKPKTSISAETVQALERSGDLVITQKRDGHAILIAVSGSTVDDVRLYSRGIVDITDKFPHLVRSISKTSIPSGTLACGEIRITDDDGKDKLGKIQSIMSSNSSRSVELQEESEYASVSLFNVISAGGALVVGESFQKRMGRMQQLRDAIADTYIEVIEPLPYSFEKAKEISAENDWEGLVLYDRIAPSEIRLDGKFDQTPRPYGCWKWKDIFEDDFVVTGWVPSKAVSHEGAVKDLKIAQYDPYTKELVDCGKVGTGLSSEDRHRLKDESLYPFVIQAEFERRFPTFKLRSGRILRIRTDKNPEECLLPI